MCSSPPSAHDVCAEDFMVTELRYLVKGFKYKDIRHLLKTSDLKQYPIVDSEGWYLPLFYICSLEG